MWEDEVHAKMTSTHGILDYADGTVMGRGMPRMEIGTLPLATDYLAQVPLELVNPPPVQSSKPWMTSQSMPRLDWRDLPFQVDVCAQMQQLFDYAPVSCPWPRVVGVGRLA